MAFLMFSTISFFTVPNAPTTTGITTVFICHILCISSSRSLYFRFLQCDVSIWWNSHINIAIFINAYRNKNISKKITKRLHKHAWTYYLTAALYYLNAWSRLTAIRCKITWMAEQQIRRMKMNIQVSFNSDWRSHISQVRRPLRTLRVTLSKNGD